MQETLNKYNMTLNQVKISKHKYSKITTIVLIIQNIIEIGLTHQQMTLNTWEFKQILIIHSMKERRNNISLQAPVFVQTHFAI